jgi:hypothetical protein
MIKSASADEVVGSHRGTADTIAPLLTRCVIAI